MPLPVIPVTNYATPVPELIKAMEALQQSDFRDLRTQDCARAVVGNAAAKLVLLYYRINTHPWANFTWRLRDAVAVLRQKAVAVYVEGSVYDKGWRNLP